jgi:hypothetical protein
LKQKLSNLIEVRKITALLIVMLFIALSFQGVLEIVFIQNIIISVVAFYFGKSTALDKPRKDEM